MGWVGLGSGIHQRNQGNQCNQDEQGWDGLGWAGFGPRHTPK